VLNKKTWIAVVIVLLGLWLFLFLKKPRHSLHSSTATSGYPAAPQFSLAGLDGRTVALSDYRGKVVLLDFWATWCAPCQAEIPRFVEWQSRYGTKGLRVIGISMDDGPGPVRAFRDRFGIDYPVALGNLKVAEDYGGILGLPVNLVIDRNGRIAAKFTGATDLMRLEKQILSLLDASTGQ